MKTFGLPAPVRLHPYVLSRFILLRIMIFRADGCVSVLSIGLSAGLP
jgi:hypothetical protein